MDQRQHQLQQWLATSLPDQFELVAIRNDASFRRYFRVLLADRTLIAMDAPPAQENCQPFIAITHILQDLGITAPQVVALDLTQGFLLLTDMGERLLLNELSPESASVFYQRAFHVLTRMQTYQATPAYTLPPFGPDFIHMELRLFIDWFIQGYLKLELTEPQYALLTETFQQLIDNAQQQPQVFIHRDFHSRNLMIFNETLAVLDFQDAMLGPITYDVVSLLKDCYIDWPTEQVEAWALAFYELLPNKHAFSAAQFLQWFDWMGLQRHLKVLGIFARLHLRDNKSSYLKNLPLVFKYVQCVSARYPTFNKFHEFLIDSIATNFVRINSNLSNLVSTNP